MGETLGQHQCVKLLVLSACETAKAGGEGGVTEQLAAFGVPGIVAMHFAVTDEGARMFTTEFYTQLAKSLSLTRALAYAREELHKDIKQHREQAPQPQRIAEWFTPVVYQNQSLGALIDGTKPYHLPDDFYRHSTFVKTEHSRLIGDGFIGRKRYLIQMRKAFRAGRHVCLQGLGGLGKTTLAEAFADNYDNGSHTTIIFRNANEINEKYILDKLLQRFKKVCKDECLIHDLEEGLNNPKIEVLDKLQSLIANYLSGCKTILIFDNAEDVQKGEGKSRIGSKGLSDFLKYLCKKAPQNCHILFTTRYKIEDLKDVLEHLPLDKMSYAEQYRLLNYSRILRKIPFEEREEVYKRLDGHPRGYKYLEVLLEKDETFTWQQVAQLEEKVFEDLLLAEVYKRLTERQKAIFQMLSAFITRTPLAALAAVSGEKEADLLPVLQSLQDWSLCFLEKNGRFEVHRLTREWMKKKEVTPRIFSYGLPLICKIREWMKKKEVSPRIFSYGLPLICKIREWMKKKEVTPQKLKKWALKAGEYFAAQPTLEDKILAKDYFEIAEAWQLFAATSFSIQGFYQRIGLYRQAIDLNQAVLDKNIDDKTNADALNYKGMAYLSLGQYDTALDYLAQSLAISQQIGDRKGEGTTLNNISQIYYAQGDYATALDYLEQSLAIMQQIGDRNGEGATLNNLAGIARAKGDYETALDYLKKSLAIQREIGDRNGEGRTLNNIGQIYDAQGDYATALGYLKKSLAIQQKIGDRSGEGVTLNNLASIAYAKGDYETALGYLKQSLAIQQEIGDRSGEGTTLNNIGQIYDAQGDYETALGYLKKSLAISQQIGDRSGEGTTLNNISQIYKVRGDYETALDYLKKSLVIQQEIGDRSGEGTTLNNISQIYKVRGDYATALRYLKQSLAISQQIGDRSGEGTTLNNISQIYDAQGDYATALDYLEQSLAIQQEIGDRSGEGTTLNNISQIYKVRGDYATALGYLKRSLAIQQEIGDRKGEGTTLNNISQIYAAKGDYDTALGYLEQSLAIRQEIGDINGMAITWGNMGAIFFEQERDEEAIPLLMSAYGIFQKIGSPDVQWVAKYLAAISKRIGEARFEEIASKIK